MPRISKKQAIITALLIWVAVVVWIGLVHEYKIMHDVPAKQPTPAVSDLTVGNLLKDVNAERIKAGVTPLKEDTLLDKSAQLKADELKQTGVYEHVSPSGHRGIKYIDEQGVQCTFEAENLAENVSGANQTVTGWFNSPAHKSAMLDPQYDTTGFGISKLANGYYVVSEHFCNLP